MRTNENKESNENKENNTIQFCPPGQPSRLTLVPIAHKIRKMRRLMGLALLSLLVLNGWQPVQANTPEVPYFLEKVNDGLLPPVQQRLPDTPSVANFAGKISGQYGGRLRMLMAKAKDIRMMTVYGYARLMALDKDLQLMPDLLEKIENEHDRVFTLHLRKGHHWSDGHPFTTEDFRFYWEDVALNKALSPYGPPTALKVADELPTFTVIDEHTVRFSWTRPNPYFLFALADPRPLYIYKPAHYLKQFHPDYTEQASIEKHMKEKRKKNWRKLFLDSARQYRFSNPELPSLQPWINTVALPAERFIFKRNPYFHRVDQQGRQLPYIDEVEINLSSNSLIPAKVGSGESDLQARYLRMDNYTFLKAAESDTGALRVLLWDTAQGSRIALYPNLNTQDPVWRGLMRDVRFRRALSMAVNRHEINQVIYFGLALGGGNSVLPSCTFYQENWRASWADFDLKAANQLLDDIGLTQRDKRGIRLLPDGRPLEIIVQTSGESTEETDVLALVKDSWAKAGIKLYAKATQREVLRNRVFSGQAHMSVWSGLPNGVPTPEMSPAQLAPTRQDQFQWPLWGRYNETGEGEPPNIPEVQRLSALNNQWSRTIPGAEKQAIWEEMLSIHADQVFTIGLISGVLQPVVVNPRLQNVPEKAIYNWSPGSFFGIYRPDTFWFKPEGA